MLLFAYSPTCASAADLKALQILDDHFFAAKRRNPQLAARCTITSAPTNPRIQEMREAQAFLSASPQLVVVEEARRLCLSVRLAKLAKGVARVRIKTPLSGQLAWGERVR